MLSNWLKESRYTVVLTGAGMSTESGLPDFRSAGKGMWTKEDPSKIASTEALNRNVERFFEFYRHRVLGLKDCRPHKGHELLAKWEKKGVIKSIITQNVDGFHGKAGSENVLELHGTLQRVHCQTCGKEYGNETYAEERFHCDCGGKLRPSVVLFGEMLPEDALMRAAEESEKADLFIVLGSSLTVTPANQFPLIAKQNGAKLVIVNMEPTEFDIYADLVINNRKIGEVLQEADKNLSRKK
ncbi:NAD-dependent protein deacylase [Lederbergia citrea]|uniref:NAD-dependent protein deacetylase n=1 Tax=Lederbergia citrea TaxID=2833581 RepID=A0A942UQT9_9BACI|nr:NAD-dependent protein deacylase [Lederbergia citrea]MBS4179446.1 NAD-dependent protein deacylase [Lederbergia citrea]MBS4206114.1 NAD-dependent protein deacylase [Lederbergia citrea]MBS4224437.1 NAD-dependent protein deacylase [Lederbergia citrea]